ncbi:MAG: thioredoxin domain-containing protein [Phycisphaerae bacterium]|nr:thioredoxin domain-containing protein [Phycisphaerae bacterium]
MRACALVGLAIAVFLLLDHVAPLLANKPFCSFFSWMDCDTVLGHPRWSKWFGIPVSALATATYVVVVIALFWPARSGRAARNRWWVLAAAATSIGLAAIWFIYLQLGPIGRVCPYCMTEHAVGLALCALVLFRVRRILPGTAGGSAVGAGVLATAVLIAGQHLQEPTYTQRTLVIDLEGRGSGIEINPSEHLVIGRPTAPRVMVKALDYTCPRCRRLAEQLRPAMDALGADYAVLALTFPLSHHCNPAYDYTDERHEQACLLARLAHAVQLAQPGRFAGFHHWLFEQQKRLRTEPGAARTEAERLVGASELARWLESPQVSERLQRDVQLARDLGVRQLPGFIAGGQVFSAFPEETGELVKLIRRVYTKPAAP